MNVFAGLRGTNTSQKNALWRQRPSRFFLSFFCQCSTSANETDALDNEIDALDSREAKEVTNIQDIRKKVSPLDPDGVHDCIYRILGIPWHHIDVACLYL